VQEEQTIEDGSGKTLLRPALMPGTKPIGAVTIRYGYCVS